MRSDLVSKYDCKINNKKINNINNSKIVKIISNNLLISTVAIF